jgi:hypothetical protein
MEEVLWCGVAFLVTLSVINFEFKAHLTSKATTAFCSDTPSHLVGLSGTIIYFSTEQWPNTPAGCVRVFYQEGVWWSAASDDLVSTIPRPQPNWDGSGWVEPQSEGKAANKCSAYVGSPSRLLEKHSRWSWLRECQECAKLSSSYLKNLKYKIYVDLFNTFGYYMIPYVLFDSVDVLTINLHCRK